MMAVRSRVVRIVVHFQQTLEGYHLRLEEPKPVLSYLEEDGAGELEPVLPPQPPLFDRLEALREPLLPAM
jgi:hypothetical protein